MGTRIGIDSKRKFQDPAVRAIIGRGHATTEVLVQLGPAYQSLPNMALAGYQSEVAALSSKMTQLDALVTQIRPLLVEIDQLAESLDEKNKGALRALGGLLLNSANRTLLDQITGSTPAPPPTSR